MKMRLPVTQRAEKPAESASSQSSLRPTSATKWGLRSIKTSSYIIQLMQEEWGPITLKSLIVLVQREFSKILRALNHLCDVQIALDTASRCRLAPKFRLFGPTLVAWISKSPETHLQT